MQTSNPALVSEIIAGAAASLRDLCIRRTARISLRSTSISKVAVPYPPLTCNTSIDGYDLSLLPQAFYRSSVAPTPEVLSSTFMEFVKARNGHKAVSKRLRDLVFEAHPGIPFSTPPGLTVHAYLLQMMHVAAWYGYDVRMGTNYAILFLPSGRHAIFSGAIEPPGERWKFRRQLGFNFERAIEYGLRPLRYTSSYVGSLYRYLNETLPELHRQIEIVIGAAVHSGSDDQDVLCKAFDVDHVRIKSKPVDMYEIQKMISTLSRSHQFPYDYMKGRLVPIIGREEFLKVFGCRAARQGRTYLEPTRLKHKVYLLALQDRLIGQLAASVKEPEQQPNHAIELQRMIR